ncbi:GGDEF domain-containing protein [Pseudorhodoferax sp.]|uniref:GGDEF domain-containing protein n=1 Tax=Pseudorhodoferax sp. TaxID=1993553 RepID=UPI002DD66686|nr:diguanylate cyclase [Pseudorhodoferax sp.]
MSLLARLSLRTLLTVPYVLLVLAAAGIIGALSYQAGRNAVDTLSGQLLVETVNRIAQAVDRHVAGSAAVLEAAFPKGVPAPASITDELGALRTRFWLATSVHLDPNNYAYYGDRQGRFFGLWRHSESEAELRLRLSGEGPRQIRRFNGIHGELQAPVLESRVFEPRQRPWFRAAQDSGTQTWTSIYIDFVTAELVATRARRVTSAAGEFEGVVATDLSLQQVNNFLRRLSLSQNGLAMVVEADGKLIGVSRGPHLKTAADGSNLRLNAADSRDPLVSATYRAVRELTRTQAASAARTGVFRDADGAPVQLGYARIRDDAGLDWLIMVAVPRSDFLHEVERTFLHSSVLAVAAAIAVLAIGLMVLGSVTRDLRRLAEAARHVSQGRPGVVLEAHRKDELGDLTRTFAAMQTRLLTDPLTGLANREALHRRIEEHIAEQRRVDEPRPFAVVFVDLNGFKAINDRYGHDMGDSVLRELALRLRDGVRESDLVARYAGDEFVLLLLSADQTAQARTVCEHLQTRLRWPLHTLPDAPTEGASFGVAMYPADGQDVDSLIKFADADMYRSKPGEQRPG